MYPKITDFYLAALLIILIARHLYIAGDAYYFYEAMVIAMGVGLRFKSKLALIFSWFFSIILAVAALRWGLDIIASEISNEHKIMGFIGLSHVPLSVGIGMISAYFMFNKELADYIFPLRPASNKTSNPTP